MANTNEYLVYGWSVQQLGNTVSQTGYGYPALIPVSASVSTAEQITGGNPSPPGAMNVQGENSGSYAAQILTNPGYGISGAAVTPGAVTAPTVPASTVAAQNPTGLNCQVSLLTGTTTVISVAPLVNGAAGTYTQVGTTSPANVSVPPGGFIKVTYSVAPTWVWIATN